MIFYSIILRFFRMTCDNKKKAFCMLVVAVILFTTYFSWMFKLDITFMRPSHGSLLQYNDIGYAKRNPDTKVSNGTIDYLAIPTETNVKTLTNVTTGNKKIMEESQTIQNNGTSRATVNNTVNIVNPHDYRYIIFSEGICKSEPVDLLVVVCTAIGKFKERQTIRETWGSDVKNASLRAKLIFILGKTMDIVEQIGLIRENNVHNDIIQEDFMDTYGNLSLKSVAMLKWSSNYCAKAKYVLKTDDDMFIHLPNIIQDAKSRSKQRFIMGCVRNKARPIQNKRSKWYAPNYKGKFYPRHTSGTAYLISGDVVGELYQSSLEVPLFWLEDIYITGILAEKISITHIHNWKYTSSKRANTGCANKKSISSHRHSIVEIKKIWNELHDYTIKC